MIRTLGKNENRNRKARGISRFKKKKTREDVKSEDQNDKTNGDKNGSTRDL